MNKLNLLPTFIFAVGFYSVQAQAAVPLVESTGLPASTVCPVPTSTVPSVKPTIKHFDKVIFQITGQLKAAVATDQVALNNLVFGSTGTIPQPPNDYDIKILDNPTKVADLKSKVLTFLGATDDYLNRQSIVIKDVEYSAVVCPQLP